MKLRRQARPSRSPQSCSPTTVHENGPRGESDDAGGGGYLESSCCDAEGGDVHGNAGGSRLDGGRLPRSSPTAAGRIHHYRKERKSSREKTNYLNNESTNGCSSKGNGAEKKVNGQHKPSHHYSGPSRLTIPTKGKKQFEDDDDGIGGSGGVDHSGGLPVLERDVKGAMIAVWLAWGVRIDATRKQFKIEEERLDGAHRAETAKVTTTKERRALGSKYRTCSGSHSEYC